MREIEARLERRCVYCREPLSKSEEEYDKQVMKRIKKNDPVAMTDMGKKHYGEGDYVKAVEYFTKAAELDHANGHACLATLYFDGKGVEKDMKKAIHHSEQAAIGGHHGSRYLLASHEIENGSMEKAVKHLNIAANLGDEESLKFIKELFMKGLVIKEGYAAALRGYQAAVNETKSAEREIGEAFYASN
jgi:TPR repeat protein